MGLDHELRVRISRLLRDRIAQASDMAGVPFAEFVRSALANESTRIVERAALRQATPPPASTR